MQRSSTHRGFTLVELAIVLVIIGLIVGGVLVGQEMIWQARNQKQITLLREVEVAIFTFHNKYNALPGDARSATAMLHSTTATIANGDGNGFIGPYPVTTYYSQLRLNTEMAQFWVHLAVAGMMGSLSPSGTSYTVNKDFPANPAASMQNTGMTPFYYNGLPTDTATPIPQVGHYLWLSHYGSDNVINTTMLRTNGAVNFLSKTLFFVDTKIDDGKPTTGRLLAPSAIAALYGTRNWTGSWSYNGACANAGSNTYLNLDKDGYTYPYGEQDPGNCYAFYRIF